jgi:hypothetical protein
MNKLAKDYQEIFKAMEKVPFTDYAYYTAPTNEKIRQLLPGKISI